MFGSHALDDALGSMNDVVLADILESWFISIRYKLRHMPFNRKELQDAAMLMCAYKFGMRPVQIAMLTLRDMRIRHELADAPTAHLTFRMVKQRSASATKSLLRRVKSEWVPLFVAMDRLARLQREDHGSRAFGVQAASEVSHRIASLLRTLLNGDATTYNLRHTAAQRLVDAGARPFLLDHPSRNAR